MDKHDSFLVDEVNNLVSSLQRLLPKKKDLIIFETAPKLTRLNDVHVEAKSVFPKCFVGAKLVIFREIMNKVKLVQQYNFGRPKETYRCFTHLINKEMEPKHAEDGLLLDSTGSATATYRETIDGSYDMRLTSKIRDLVCSETEIEFEKESSKSVSSVTCSMKDVDPNTLKMVGHWIYKVTPDFSMGSELGFRPLTLPSKPDFSVSARYERPSFVISSTVSKLGFQVCLFKQFSPDLRIATVVHEGRSSSPTIGLAIHKDYYKGSELKIFVDSQKCGGFTFQKDVLFHETVNDVRVLRLVFSTLIDRQRRVKLGFGFNLDF